VSRGITGFGAYVPRWRLDRQAVKQSLSWLSQGKSKALGTRSYCNWDEDALTLGVEAARDCLSSVSAQPDAIWLASTSLPFADRSNAGLLAAALDVAPACQTLDSAGSLRAATSALISALSNSSCSLIVGSDARKARPASPQELSFGHAAAAVLVGNNQIVAEHLGSHSVAIDFVDHYRATHAEFDYALEERWVRDEGYQKIVPPAIAALLTRCAVSPSQITHLLMPTGPAIATRLAKDCGIAATAVVDPLHTEIGDTGTGHPLLMLCHTLETAAAGALILLIGFGQGVDALLFRVPTKKPSSRPHRGVSSHLTAGKTDTMYTRYLAHQGLLDVDFGMRAERDARTAQSAAYRRHRDLTAFVGGRCSQCKTLQFPYSRVCVNPDCRLTDTQTAERIADVTGAVKSFTEDWLAYSPNPPLAYGNVNIGDGGNVFMEFADVEPGVLSVGLPVRMVFRIKDVDRVRGFHRYFWKATPVGS
jgi:3-hydroxy-3-methylglutaryl CoA synthase